VSSFLRLNSGRALAALLAVYLIVSGAYSVVVALGEGEDENEHFAVIRHYRTTGEVPDLRQAEALGPGERHQPPLYYTLAALLGARLIALAAGMYRLGRGSRLEARDENGGRWPNDAFTLSLPIVIGEP
jgi:hypothetical protein